MNDPVVLNDIRFEVDLDVFLGKLRISEHPECEKRAVELARRAEAIARPRAMYRVAYIESKGDDTVVAEGTRLTSRVLQVNLEKTHRIFPFVATCGRRLYEWSQTIDDVLDRFFVDTLMEMACRVALDAKRKHLADHVGPGRLSMMTPGSLPDWPIEQQRPLFQMLGNVREAIGVELTDSFLMVPVKSVSGIAFSLDTDFTSCQLCPRDVCAGRRAAYDSDLYARKYVRRR